MGVNVELGYANEEIRVVTWDASRGVNGTAGATQLGSREAGVVLTAEPKNEEDARLPGVPLAGVRLPGGQPGLSERNPVTRRSPADAAGRR
jgi:hypothetical protein